MLEKINSLLPKGLQYAWTNVLTGLTVYAAGDLIASLIRQEFSPGRTFGMVVIGALIYALEIPAWFRLVDQWNSGRPAGLNTSLRRTLLAMAYFNPLWIARHLLFVNVFAGQWSDIGWHLIQIGAESFLWSVPLSLAGNHIIQNVLRLRWRFLGSAVFSGLLAIYYALSEAWFA